MRMNRLLGLLLLAGAAAPISAQRLLTLDSCRAMALRNNKQLSISKVKQDIAANLRRSARTKYLPHVSAIGSYMHTTERVSLLTADDQHLLSNLGTVVTSSPEFQTGYGAVNDMMAGLGKAAPMLGILGYRRGAVCPLVGGSRLQPRQRLPQPLHTVGRSDRPYRCFGAACAHCVRRMAAVLPPLAAGRGGTVATAQP